MKTQRWMALAVALVASWSTLQAADSTTTKKSTSKAKKSSSSTKAAKPAATNQVQKASAPTPLMQPEKALVKADNVNVRGKASFTGEVITKLKKGEQITLLEEITLKKPAKDEPARWFRIAMPANTPVWIHTGFVDTNANVISSKKLNVRSGPGENFSVVGVMQKGDAVKEIRKVNEWIEIETPTNAYAFVSTEMIARQAPPAIAAATPPPAPEHVVVPETKPVTTQPAPVAQTSPPITTEPAPIITPPPLGTPPPLPVEQPLPKRIVHREGIIRNSANIQASTPYVLVSAENGKMIDFLQCRNPDLNLKLYLGFRVLITGEEGLDPRWKTTPVLYFDSLELP